MRTLGTVALILGIVETLYCLYVVAASLFSGRMMEWQKRAFAGMPGGNAEVFDSMEKTMRQVAVGQTLRMIAFMAVSTWLIVIAVQLIKGRVDALGKARSWIWLAFGALAISALIQGIVLVPAQIASQQEMLRWMSTSPGPPPPPGFVTGISILSRVMMVATPVVGTILLAAWPVALRLWATKIQKQMEQAPAEPAPHPA